MLHCVPSPESRPLSVDGVPSLSAPGSPFISRRLHPRTRDYLDFQRAASASAQILREPENIQRLDTFFRRFVNNFDFAELVDGWISFAGYSIGTGSLLPSIKGSNPGTLTNGPTWGVNGLTYTGFYLAQVYARVPTNLLPATPDFSVAFLASSVGSNLGGGIGGAPAAIAIGSDSGFYRITDNWTSPNCVVNLNFRGGAAHNFVTITLTGEQAATSTVNGASAVGLANGRDYSNFSRAGYTQIWQAAGSGLLTTTSGLTLIFKTRIHDRAFTLRQIVKETIGQHLALP